MVGDVAVFKTLVKTTGQTFQATYLNNRLQTQWKLKGTMEIIVMGYNHYIVHGLIEEDKTKIIAARPWRLGKHPLLVRTWVPNFLAEKESTNNVIEIWMQIKYLPIEYHLPEVLIMLGNSMRKIVAFDARNAHHQQAHHTRIYAEVSLNAHLPNSISVNHYLYEICPENLHSFFANIYQNPPETISFQTWSPDYQRPNGQENSKVHLQLASTLLGGNSNQITFYQPTYEPSTINVALSDPLQQINPSLKQSL